MDRPGRKRQEISGSDVGSPSQESNAIPLHPVSSDPANPEIDVASAFAGSAAALEVELSRDLERLRTAALVADSESAWVDQYPDEASALIALGQRQPSEKIPEPGGKNTASAPGAQSVQLDWMEPAWQGLDSVASGSLGGVDSRQLQSQSAIRYPQSAGPTLADSHSDELSSPPLTRASRLTSSVDMGQPTPKEFTMGRVSEGWAGATPSINVPDGGEDNVSAAESKQMLDKLQNELQEAREELSVARQRISQQSANGSKAQGSNGDSARHEPDPRSGDLRQRVIKAQQALDERARKLRDALSHERAKLKAYHAKLQKKAQELAVASRRQAIGPENIRDRAELEARRNELSKRSGELEVLEGTIREAGRAELAQRRAELEQMAKAQLSARQTQLEMRERALEERESRLQEVVNSRAAQIKKEASQWESRLGTRQKVLSEREAGMEAKARERLADLEREIANRKAESERTILSRNADLERELARREAEIDAKHKGLAEREARIEQERAARLGEVEREASARESGLEVHKRALFKREAELEQTVSARHSDLKREFTEKLAELDKKRDAMMKREAELEQSVANRVGDLKREIAAQQAELTSKQDNIIRREAQLEQVVNQRVADLRRELVEEQAGLKARYAMLSKKEAEIELLAQSRVADLKRELTQEQAEYEVKKRSLFERESKLEQTIAGRLAELDKQAAARRVELEERERALQRSQSDLSARVEAFDKIKDSQEAQLKARAVELAEQIRIHQESIVRQEELIRTKVSDALGRREADLEYLKTTLEDREKALAAKETSLTGIRGEIDERQAALSARALELDQRDHDLARQTLDLQIREHKIDQRKGEVEIQQRELDGVRHELEVRLRAAEESETANRDLKSRLEKESAEFQKDSEELQHREELFTSRLSELENRETELKSRTDEIQTLNRDLDMESRRLSEEREKLADLEERAKEIEGRRLDLDVRIATYQDREDAITARQARLDRETGEFAKVRAEVDRFRADFIIKEKELESREAALAKRIQQAQEQESVFDEAQKDLERQQQEIAKLRAVHAEKFAEARKREAELAEQQNAIEQSRVDLDHDRDQLAAQADSLRDAHLALRKEHEAFLNEKAAFEVDRGQLQQKTIDLQRLSEELVARRTEMEAEAARLDRDRVAVRDKERMLAEQNAALSQAQQRAEDARHELTARIEDTEEIRRQILAKAERMRQRKARLAEDASTVDKRLRQLHQEMEAARQERHKLTQERESMERTLQSLLADRQKLEQEREEFEENRANAQESQSSIEEQKRRLAEREERISQRARQLESFGTSLKQQLSDLQRQQQEWAELQGRFTPAEKAVSLMRLAEDRERELRGKEESLRSHEEALSSCAAEVAEAQQDLERRNRALEEKTRELERQTEQIVRQRDEIDQAAARQRAAIEEIRSNAGSDLAEERIRLREHEQELEAAYIARREALESDAAVREENYIQELRQKVEADMEQKLANLAQREQDTQRRCESRMAEIERDIESRLESFETQLRQRRESTEADLLRHRSAVEAEVAESRSALQRQLEEVKRREVRLADSDSNLGAKLVSPVVREPAEARSHRRPIREDDSFDFPSSGKPHNSPLDDSDIQFAADESSMGSQEPVVLEDDELEFVSDADVPAQAAVSDATPVRRRLRLSRALCVGLIAGGLAACAYLYTPPSDITLRGRFHLAGVGKGIGPSAQEHLGDMLKPGVFEEASRIAGVDLKKLYHDKSLFITDCPTGDCVDVSAIAPIANREDAQKWVNAMGKAYTAALGRIANSDDEVKKRISALETARRPNLEKTLGAQKEVQSLEESIRNDPRASGLETARGKKAKLKEKLGAAMGHVEQVKKTLADFEKQPVPSGPVVPTQKQLREVLDKDVELLQAMQQQQAKAVEFHIALRAGMIKAHAPIPELNASIEAMVAETQRQIEAQTDKDIRGQLEQVAKDLADYRGQAIAFGQNWDELGPKIEDWKSGADPQLLLDYQQKAEKLIREFHSDSRTSFGQAAKKADEIAAGGSEMTKRRIIQSALTSLARSALKARNAWTISAREVVPQYNLELKALRNAIRDLTPRIDESRAAHKQKLAETLGKRRTQEHQAQLIQLREQLEIAHQRHQKLSDEFMKIDSAVALNDRAAADIQKKRNLIDGKKTEIAALQGRSKELDEEIERVKSSRRISSAGAVSYAALDPIQPAMFDFKKKDVAAGIGLLFFSVTTAGLLLLAYKKSPQPQ